jgi:hypothetical protein
VPACSEASFGKPAPEKKQPSFLRLASQQGKPLKQAGAVLGADTKRFSWFWLKNYLPWATTSLTNYGSVTSEEDKHPPTENIHCANLSFT